MKNKAALKKLLKNLEAYKSVWLDKGFDDETLAALAIVEKDIKNNVETIEIHQDLERGCDHE